MRFFGIILSLLLACSSALADVELALKGKHPVLLTEVYLHEGEPFMALDDVLDAVGMRGDWDAVHHLYRFRAPAGKVTLSPGSRFVQVGEFRFELKHRPRFIDSRLRVGEDFILEQLPRLTGSPIYYRNLSPAAVSDEEPASATERLFAFLTRRKVQSPEAGIRSVLIDPAHGGADAGSIVRGAPAEKEIVLALGEKLARKIKMDLGTSTEMTRSGDYALSAEQRLDQLTESGADLYLSLHAQAGFSPESQGIAFAIPPSEAFYDPEAETRSLRLVEDLAEALEREGFVTTGLYRPAMASMASVPVPSVRLELGYLSNAEDLAMLTGSEGQERLVRALFAGIRTFSNQLKEKSP